MQTPTSYTHDAIILGAGASGLMAAYTASQRGVHCLLTDQAKSGHLIARKLRIAGGGMGNVTNLHVSPRNYVGRNATGFTMRALQHTPPAWFLDRLQNWHIPIEERIDNQIFCTVPAARLVDALVKDCRQQSVDISLSLDITVNSIARPDNNTFILHANNNTYSAPQLLIALGSIAWPSAHSTNAGLQIAKHFGHTIIPPRPVLVPLIMPDTWPFTNLQGISLDVTITTADNTLHHGALLFTHKGISGPAVLRASTCWHKNDPLRINWLPKVSIIDLMHTPQNGTLTLLHLLKRHLPTRLAEYLYTALPPETMPDPDIYINSISKKTRQNLAKYLHEYTVTPKRTVGFQKAEVMAGGIATEDISPKTMASKLCNGLFIIGECLDITGNLGGYNLHWAWASGRAAGNTLKIYKGTKHV